LTGETPVLRFTYLGQTQGLPLLATYIFNWAIGKWVNWLIGELVNWQIGQSVN